MFSDLLENADYAYNVKAINVKIAVIIIIVDQYHCSIETNELN